MEVVPLRSPTDSSAITDSALERLMHVATELNRAKEVVVGIGAGVSTSSGVPDFRGSSSSSLYSSTRRSPTPSLSSPSFPSSSQLYPTPPPSTSSLSPPPPPPAPSPLLLPGSDLGPQTLKHLFSFSALLQPSTRAQHLKLMLALHERARGVRKAVQKEARRAAKGKGKEGEGRGEGGPTAFHALLRSLRDGDRLARVWSQNVDGLEGVAGLEYVDLAPSGSSVPSEAGRADAVDDDSASEWEESAAARRRRSSVATMRPARKRRRLSTAVEGRPSQREEGREENRGKVVALHGTLSAVVCTLCGGREAWKKRHSKAFGKGEGATCKSCEKRVQTRLRASKRTTTSSTLSFLRPAIVLYDDPSPSSLSLSSAASSLLDVDLSAPDPAHLPDFLLVAGTSLRIPGFKNLVKEVAKTARRRGGLCVMVNREGVGKEWEGVFDYHFLGDTDDFATTMLDLLSAFSAPVEPSPPPASAKFAAPFPTPISQPFSPSSSSPSPSTSPPPFRPARTRSRPQPNALDLDLQSSLSPPPLPRPKRTLTRKRPPPTVHSSSPPPSFVPSFPDVTSSPAFPQARLASPPPPPSSPRPAPPPKRSIAPAPSLTSPQRRHLLGPLFAYTSSSRPSSVFSFSSSSSSRSRPLPPPKRTKHHLRPSFIPGAEHAVHQSVSMGGGAGAGVWETLKKAEKRVKREKEGRRERKRERRELRRKLREQEEGGGLVVSAVVQ